MWAVLYCCLLFSVGKESAVRRNLRLLFHVRLVCFDHLKKKQTGEEKKGEVWEVAMKMQVILLTFFDFFMQLAV